VYNVEGNPGCKQILTNSALELKTTSPVFGQQTTITLGAQTIKYEVAADGKSITSWKSTTNTPVNAVVIKKSSNAGSIIYHFGTPGVTEDTDEPAGSVITALSFCWGVSGTTVQESAYEPCPPGLEDALDGLDQKFVVVGIENGNTQGKPFQCVTPRAEVTPCSYLTGQSNSCDDHGLKAPQSVDFYEGSTVSCNTSGGKVKCNTVTWP
jgi:hypothetical protein